MWLFNVIFPKLYAIVWCHVLFVLHRAQWNLEFRTVPFYLRVRRASAVRGVGKMLACLLFCAHMCLGTMLAFVPSTADMCLENPSGI